MDIQSVVARVLSHNHNLLLPVKEVEVIPLGTLPQGCSDEGLPWKARLHVVMLSSFGLSLASSSAFSFPGKPQRAGTHCRTTRLCFATS